MSASPFIIAPVAGFTPEIGRLVAMMTYARQTTIDAARGLTVEQLDRLHDRESNSIGSLLAHIAAVEVAYQLDTFEHRDFTEEELKVWGAALDLGEAARREIRGFPLDHYVERLTAIRTETLEELAKRDDAWLDEEREFSRGRPANNYFKWFHVMEDELSHRGQIRWLAKRG